MSVTTRQISFNFFLKNTKFVEISVFYFFIFLYLIPIFIGKYTLTHDGPAHLYNATLLKYFWQGKDAFLSQYYQVNQHVSTNWVSNGLLAWLMYLVPDFVAEKIIQGLYLIGLPLAFRYALRKLNPSASVYSLFIFPILYNKVFIYGFYGQLLSFVVLFGLFGRWVSARYPFSRKDMLVFMALTLVIELLHPLTFLFSILITGSFLINYLVDWQPGQAIRFPAMPTVGKALIRYVIIYLPSSLLFLYFLLNSQGTEKIYFPHEQLKFLKELVSLYQVLDTDESWFAVFLFRLLVLGMLGVSIGVLGQARKKRPHAHWLALGLIMGITLVLYLGMPEHIAGGFIIRPRLAFLLCAFLILALAHLTTATSHKPIWLIGNALALGFCLYQGYYYYQMHLRVSEILSARHFIPNHSVVLPYTGIRYSSRFEKTVRLPHPFIHISNYLCLGKETVCLHNYQAQYDYFPIHGKRWDFKLETIVDSLPPIIKPSIAEMQQMSHMPVSHVVLLGVNEDDPLLGNGQIAIELKQKFRQTYVSTNRWVKVYERK